MPVSSCHSNVNKLLDTYRCLLLYSRVMASWICLWGAQEICSYHLLRQLCKSTKRKVSMPWHNPANEGTLSRRQQSLKTIALVLAGVLLDSQSTSKKDMTNCKDQPLTVTIQIPKQCHSNSTYSVLLSFDSGRQQSHSRSQSRKQKPRNFHSELLLENFQPKLTKIKSRKKSGSKTKA